MFGVRVGGGVRLGVGLEKSWSANKNGGGIEEVMSKLEVVMSKLANLV